MPLYYTNPGFIPFSTRATKPRHIYPAAKCLYCRVGAPLATRGWLLDNIRLSNANNHLEASVLLTAASKDLIIYFPKARGTYPLAKRGVVEMDSISKTGVETRDLSLRAGKAKG